MMVRVRMLNGAISLDKAALTRGPMRGQVGADFCLLGILEVSLA